MKKIYEKCLLAALKFTLCFLNLNKLVHQSQDAKIVQHQIISVLATRDIIKSAIELIKLMITFQNIGSLENLISNYFEL